MTRPVLEYWPQDATPKEIARITQTVHILLHENHLQNGNPHPQYTMSFIQGMDVYEINSYTHVQVQQWIERIETLPTELRTKINCNLPEHWIQMLARHQVVEKKMTKKKKKKKKMKKKKKTLDLFPAILATGEEVAAENTVRKPGETIPITLYS